MNIIKELLHCVRVDSLIFECNMKSLTFFVLYLLIFLILFLENAVILGIFLPGDSLLIVIGVLVAKGILNFFITLGILTVATSLGSWISYLQGKLLYNNKVMKSWLSYLPCYFYQKANNMFNKYGLTALFIGRFIAVVRTALPTIAGVSGLSTARFQVFNWISSFFWVLILIVFGVLIERFTLFFN